MEIILASASPRRRDLLRQVGVFFRVVPSEIDEQVHVPMSPPQLVEHLALSKALNVLSRHSDVLVIGADTIVVIDGQILGKPHDKREAISMLERLSGRTHEVLTGVALVSHAKQLVCHEVTSVRFRELDRNQIERYVDCGESMDKAGAYGAQGRAAAIIESIHGDYFSVIGLPLCRTIYMLEQFGVEVL